MRKVADCVALHEAVPAGREDLKADVQVSEYCEMRLNFTKRLN